MDRESVDRLRFDRRLEQRRGWVEDADKSAHIEALPDVSAKMIRGLDDPDDEAEAQTTAAPAEPALSAFPTLESTPAPGFSSVPGGTGDGTENSGLS